MVRTSWWGRDSSSSTDRMVRQCRASFPSPLGAYSVADVGMTRRSARGGPRARALGALALVVGAACTPERPTAPPPLPPELPTVADRLAQYGDGARARMRPYFAVAGVAYPPSRVVL